MVITPYMFIKNSNYQIQPHHYISMEQERTPLVIMKKEKPTVS